MDRTAPDINERLSRRGLSRRQFLKFCSVMAATLTLPITATFEIAQALAATPRIPLVWLEFQDCTGDTEAFLRANNPTFIDFIFDMVSLNYHETLMVPAGFNAELSLHQTLTNYAGQYICVVEGSIPAGDGGVYCLIGGRTALSIAQEVCSNARLNIAAGTCAWDGGLPGANPNPTGAVGLATAVPNAPNQVNMPGCPVNGVNLMATIVHFLTYNTLPPLDTAGRPQFAYQNRIHSSCERRGNPQAQTWGDAAHRNNGCLKAMGCRGPSTNSNCYQRNWNGNTNWPIGAGHHCIGCVNSRFWDASTSFYS